MVKLKDMVKLDDKDFLPEKKENWIITDKSSGEEISIVGDMIPQNKQITNIASGYMHYFRTEEGLKKFSAFNYDIKKDSFVRHNSIYPHKELEDVDFEKLRKE